MLASTALSDTLFLRALRGEHRLRVAFSHDEVARLKAAAMLPAGDGIDAWISTQEALVAHLLVTLGRRVLPGDSRGRSVVGLCLDAREALALPPGQCFGSGMVCVYFTIAGVQHMRLSHAAQAVHEAIQTKGSAPTQKCQWQLLAGAFERRLEFDALLELLPRKGRDYDYFLEVSDQLNELPNFGVGGIAQSVVTNEGATVILPMDHGVQVLLHPRALQGPRGFACEAEDALKALHHSIPATSQVAATITIPAGEKTAPTKPMLLAASLAADASRSAGKPTVVGAVPKPKALRAEQALPQAPGGHLLVPAGSERKPESNMPGVQQDAQKEVNWCVCGRGGICVCCDLATDW